MFLIIGFATGLTAGLAIPLAQTVWRQGLLAWHSFMLYFIYCYGDCVNCTQYDFLSSNLEIMQTPSEIIDGAYDYLIVIFGGIFVDGL